MKNIITIIFLTLFVSSCKKDKLNIPSERHAPNDYVTSRNIIGLYTNEVVSPYYQFGTVTNCNTYFYSATSLVAESKGMERNAGIMATALDNSNNDIADLTFKVNSVEIKYLNQEVGYKPIGISNNDDVSNLGKTLNSFFGRDNKFTCAKGDVVSVSQPLYVPANLTLKNIYGNITAPIEISTGTVLNWNADVNNKNGVIVRVTALNDKERQFVENIAFVKDECSFTITQDLIDKIPTGLNVMVEVIRGNIITTKDNEGRSYKLYAYTTCSHNFVKR